MRLADNVIVKTAQANPALNLAPSGHWTALKRRRLALRYAVTTPNAVTNG